MKLAIVIPCYNEEEALGITVGRLTEILDRLTASGKTSPDSFIYCVDDGSKDNTWQQICLLNSRDRRVKGHTLAHNRGHQYALLSGLMAVREHCDAAVSIDADLQDDPEAITAMVDAFAQGNEIVYGVRRSRETDTWFKRTTARAFYRLQSIMGLQTVYDHADYRLMSSRALEILSQYKESNIFLRGIVPQIGLQTAVVTYDRHARIAGESKYPLKKMLAFSVDGIVSFSAKPIRLVFLTGLIIMIADILVALYVLISYLTHNVSIGWSSLMLSVWFLGSLILMSIGIIGEYIGRIFIEVKNRPLYNIRESVGDL